MRHPRGDRTRVLLPDRPHGHPDRRYALTSFRVGNTWEFEAFRDYVVAAAANIPGVTTQADIARVTGVSPSILSKWFRGEMVPSDANLRRVQVGFAENGVTVKLRDLARLAGRIVDEDNTETAEPAVVTLGHRLAREIDQMLAPASPIPVPDREALETVLDRLIEPYRRQMRRRRSA